MNEIGAAEFGQKLPSISTPSVIERILNEL